MKRLLVVFCGSIILLLAGCSLLNEATNTVTYIKEATDFLSKATTFANEAPSLAQQAVNNSEAAKELENMLQEMKQEIEVFNAIEAPQLAADLHQQLVDQNNIISQGIDLYLENIKDGKLDPAILQNTEIFQGVQELSSIIDQIKKLGQ